MFIVTSTQITMNSPKISTGHLASLLRQKEEGISPVQPEKIGEGEKNLLMLLFLESKRASRYVDRKIAKEAAMGVLLGLNPEFIFDETMMYNGRINTRTVQDIIYLFQ